MQRGRVLSVNVGRVRRVRWNDRTVETAILKEPVEGPVHARPLGLEGDEQANREVHGGVSKAVYAYPSEHYAFWKTVRAQARVSLWDDPLPFGSVGENLSIAGLLEEQVWVGDLLRFPHCVLAVSEPRIPCSKFNLAMGFSQAAKLMAQSRWCGFYLAVREPGQISSGDAFELVAGPREVNIRELFQSRMGPSG